MQLQTERLIVRPWRDRDVVPYAALNADPEVMQYFPKVMTTEESSARIAWFEERRRTRGLGFLALERKADGAFNGVRLMTSTFFDRG